MCQLWVSDHELCFKLTKVSGASYGSSVCITELGVRLSRESGACHVWSISAWLWTVCQTDPGVVGAFHVSSMSVWQWTVCQTDPGVVGAFHLTVNCVSDWPRWCWCFPCDICLWVSELCAKLTHVLVVLSMHHLWVFDCELCVKLTHVLVVLSIRHLWVSDC